MNTLDGTLFLLISFGGLIVLTWLTNKSAKVRNMQDTIDSDKRTQTQYALRSAKRTSNIIIGILAGVIIGTIIVLALQKPEPNQRVKPIIRESLDSIIE